MSSRLTKKRRSKSVGHDPEKNAALHTPSPYDPRPILTVKQTPEGYSRLAAFVNVSEDLAIFRRFGALRARSLLYRQTELAAKERQLTEIDAREADEFEEEQESIGGDSENIPPGNNTRRAGHRSQDILQNRQWLTDNTERREVMTSIRELLKEYDEELFRYKRILEIPQAQSFQLKYFRRWMKSRPLVALESHFLDDDEDVIALRKPPEDALALADWLSDFKHKSGKILRTFFKRRTPAAVKDDPNIEVYSVEKKHYAGRIFFAIIAAAVLLVGVVALYFVKTAGGRLGVLCGATAACTLVIATMTNAKKSEVFGASAAYCAVLVVFVGTTLNH